MTNTIKKTEVWQCTKCKTIHSEYKDSCIFCEFRAIPYKNMEVSKPDGLFGNHKFNGILGFTCKD